jgi:hypothetical protein
VIPAERFTGTVQHLGAVDDRSLMRWIAAIPFEDWPQQTPLEGALRPAMVNDPAWHAFGAESTPVAREILSWTTGRELGRLLSVVMPGQSIPEHVDKQAPGQWVRVHVPLMSNASSVFIVGGEAHRLHEGQAYLVNIGAPHSVVNHGITPRIHFMLDIGAP